MHDRHFIFLKTIFTFTFATKKSKEQKKNLKAISHLLYISALSNRITLGKNQTSDTVPLRNHLELSSAPQLKL
jgi:hypothetical protein